MDLLRGASDTGGRVLAARHITADQALPSVNNAVNSSLLCHSMDSTPDFKSYTTALQMYAPVLWSFGAIATLTTSLVFLLSLHATYKRRRSSFVNVSFILAVYPVVTASALIAIMVPRARVLTEAMAQQVVMVGMYHLFCLIIAECGGTDQLIRCAEGARLETRVLPCCCWPCCIIPRPVLHRTRIKTLRYLVLQMPIVQAILYAIVLVLWSEDKKLYNDSFVFIQPLIASSILLGVWCMIMCVRAAESAGFRPRAKFLALQTALLIVKLQGGSVKVLPQLVSLPCFLPLHPQVFLNLIHNCVMFVEMFLLAVWAWYIYSDPTEKVTHKVQQAVVAVLEDTPKATIKNFKFRNEGIQNKSFMNELMNG